VTGKPPVSRDGHIVKVVRNTWDQQRPGIYELLDPVLVDTPLQELETFVKLALECVEDTSIARPSMHEVVKQLETLVGPKSFFGDNNTISLPTKRKERVPVPVSTQFSNDIEPASGQFSHASTSASALSQQSSCKYSGAFKPSPR